MSVNESFLIRDSINSKVVEELSRNIKSSFTSFQSKKFENNIVKKIPDLGLMERIDLVTDALFHFLPDNFTKSLDVLLSALPPELPNHSKGIQDPGLNRSAGLNGFIMIAITNYVARYGLKHFTPSMDAFYEMTKRFSAEGSIRHFIKIHPEKTLRKIEKWTADDNMHVRRLCSECTRPRLPWAMQLTQFIEDPSPILPILETLKNDPELYVRRSVANNLNDISKDNPKVVNSRLKLWNKDASPDMQWLVRHALRSLIKTGNLETLSILGFSKNPKIDVLRLKLSKKNIILGENLEFTAIVESKSKKDQWLMIDFILHHKKSNGKLSEKVFKLKKVFIKANSKIDISKRHPMKEISTRKYYAGEHEIQLQINGKKYPSETFHLKLK